MKKPMIAKREDGFTIMRAKFGDFPKFYEASENLSEETKKFYNPWMFKKNPSLKIKLGQILARLSLIPTFGKIIKKIFPYGYAITIECQSPDRKLAGLMCMYNFMRLRNGKYSVTESKVVFEKFQNLGLGGFLTESFIDVAKKENVHIIKSGTRSDNLRNKKIYEKYGWNLKQTIPNGYEYEGKLFDWDIWYLELT